MNCTRCKRAVGQNKYFNATKKLCIYCYDILFDQVPCVDCFQLLERKVGETSTQLVLCDVCRAQRAHSTSFCTRTWFKCSQCASIHNQWCTQPHATDLGVSANTLRARTRHLGQYRSSRAPDGFYQWDRFLFCSKQCVQQMFAQSTWCALCGKHQSALQRCEQCQIPLCKPCAQYWFNQGMCNQCFGDRHPTWPICTLKHVTSLDVNDPVLKILRPTVRQTVMNWLRA
jgi:hypothetical protein